MPYRCPTMKKDTSAASRVVLISCALLSASAWLLATRDGAAQRAPLLVVRRQPIDESLAAHPRAHVFELRVDHDGAFVFNGRAGRLSPAQLAELRRDLSRVRWVMAPSTFLCDAIATESHVVQSGNRRMSWRSPCEPAPHASVIRIEARAEALMRSARSAPTPVDGGVPADAATDAGGDSAARATDLRDPSSESDEPTSLRAWS